MNVPSSAFMEPRVFKFERNHERLAATGNLAEIFLARWDMKRELLSICGKTCSDRMKKMYFRLAYYVHFGAPSLLIDPRGIIALTSRAPLG
jgi:hypothetical protein